MTVFITDLRRMRSVPASFRNSNHEMSNFSHLVIRRVGLATPIEVFEMTAPPDGNQDRNREIDQGIHGFTLKRPSSGVP